MAIHFQSPKKKKKLKKEKQFLGIYFFRLTLKQKTKRQKKNQAPSLSSLSLSLSSCSTSVLPFSFFLCLRDTPLFPVTFSFVKTLFLSLHVSASLSKTASVYVLPFLCLVFLFWVRLNVKLAFFFSLLLYLRLWALFHCKDANFPLLYNLFWVFLFLFACE